ncbi:hypothetical protein QJS04_geneDACA011807 [Acorus gramineus]|uniref:Uncharacterized protein n=1 Tax=Acorus gramineus TaxID=55184 RepID=A0AAV9BF47_ACOGR|nr:hypothetical protein QJS04_geneDACA011807 [Acorus gramineus]
MYRSPASAIPTSFQVHPFSSATKTADQQNTTTHHQNPKNETHLSLLFFFQFLDYLLKAVIKKGEKKKQRDNQRKMKHSNETSGFSSNSFAAAGNAAFSTPHPPSSSGSGNGARRGDAIPLLDDELRPSPFGSAAARPFAGDADLLPDLSPGSRRTPFAAATAPPPRLLAACTTSLPERDFSARLEGDGEYLPPPPPPRSLRIPPGNSPERDRFLCTLAGDADLLSALHSRNLSSSSAFSVAVVAAVETLSLRLQISDASSDLSSEMRAAADLLTRPRGGGAEESFGVSERTSFTVSSTGGAFASESGGGGASAGIRRSFLLKQQPMSRVTEACHRTMPVVFW